MATKTARRSQLEREWRARILGETYVVEADTWHRARWRACRLYLAEHPNSRFSVSQLIQHEGVSVRVAKDRRRSDDFD